MKTRQNARSRLQTILWIWLLPLSAAAQVPVDDAGNPIGEFEDSAYSAGTSPDPVGDEGIPLLAAAELEELVGPIALYPDDLLAIVLPASTYPLQVVQAARFLDELETNPALEPDPDWDDSIVALVNYPEVVDLLNEDLDWTWRLGEAVIAQEADVVTAVESFRNRAYAAGNLKSDAYQKVREDEGLIEITPVRDDIIYVPYYEPERVVYRQPARVYYYYPTAYPVYYYPYPSSYAFHSGFFWGVTTAFTIGWHTDHLRVFHHSYRGHPYYGHDYWHHWWYRRPTIHVHNHIYAGNRHRTHSDYYVRGDRWRPSRRVHVRHADRDTYTRSRGHYRREVDSVRPGHTLRTQREIDRSRHRLSNVRIVDGRDRISRDANRSRTRSERVDKHRSRQTVPPAANDRSRQTAIPDRRNQVRDERRALPVERGRSQRDSRIGQRQTPQLRQRESTRRSAPVETRPAVRPRPAERRAAPSRPRSAPPTATRPSESRAPRREARQETRGGRSVERRRRR